MLKAVSEGALYGGCEYAVKTTARADTKSVVRLCNC